MADPNSSSTGDPSSTPTSSPGTVAPTKAPAPSDPTSGAEARLTDLVTALVPFLTAVLTPVERKATPKVKKKGESLMGVFFRLALKRPELAPGRDPQELYN